MSETSLSQTHPDIPRISILGVGVSPINMDIAVEHIERWIDSDARQYVCIRDVNGIMESRRDERVHRAHRDAGLVTPDGMPIVWLLKLAGMPNVSRVYGPDLMLRMFDESQHKGYKHFLYGSTNNVLNRLRESLQQEFPKVAIVGTYAPPPRAAGMIENDVIIERINSSGADIVWVGLGTPKQELWMADHRARLNAAALIGVGAAFDFHAGVIRQAPAFLQRLGFEWFFRMAMEPRRLGKRYLRNVPEFLALLVVEKLRSAIRKNARKR